MSKLEQLSMHGSLKPIEREERIKNGDDKFEDWDKAKK